MGNRSYDAIVLGLGGVGSAAAYHLALAGHKVLGLDQFSPPHQRGSSHGETRIIRKAYFEHESYVPLLCRAYELWHDLEQQVGRRLLHLTGLIEIGPENGTIIPGIRNSAARFELPIEEMTMRDAIRRYPSIRGNDSWRVIIEKDAGYLLVEACVDAHLKLAQQLGATMTMNQSVIDWQPSGSGVVVRTRDTEYHAGHLVVAAGPWAGRVLKQYGTSLTVLRKHLYWYETDSSDYLETNGFPCFFYETPMGYFYGFPERDSHGLKLAQHSGGEAVLDEIDGKHFVDAVDQQSVESFLQAYLPQVSHRMTRTVGCYYTMTPDEHFIVDSLPNHPQVVVVAGLSGHGFKFTSVLGEIAASMTANSANQEAIGFLRLSRLQQS